MTTDATLAALKQQSENYLETAIAQEAVMDQILVHMLWRVIREVLVRNYPITSAESQSNFLKAIANNIKSPQPLDTLLNQLNRDFAVPLLAQCYRIAKLDGKTTPVEARVIETITTKFDLT